MRLVGLDRIELILLVLMVEFGLMILVSSITRPHSRDQLDPFFARLLTPVGREHEVRTTSSSSDSQFQESDLLDYAKASQFGVASLREFGIELPRYTRADWFGFLAAWAMVFGLIALVVWLAGFGR
jgi:hypothetical protein